MKKFLFALCLNLFLIGIAMADHTVLKFTLPTDNPVESQMSFVVDHRITKCSFQEITPGKWACETNVAKFLLRHKDGVYKLNVRTK